MTRISYECLDDDFRLKSRSFKNQYAHIYFFRLNVLRPMVLRSIPSEIPRVSRVLELQSYVSLASHDGSVNRVAVVGTLFKEMKLKPSVLRPATLNANLASICSDEDTLILEDESGRVRLVLEEGCTYKVHDLPTGIVVGLVGRPLSTGEFLVREFTFAGIAPQTPLSKNIQHSNEFVWDPNAPHLLLVDSPSPLYLAQLMDFVHMNDSIVRVILAGNALAVDSSGSSGKTSNANTLNSSSQSSQQGCTAHASSKQADESIAELCGSVGVDLMPGRNDPANHLVPQQPIHPCLLSASVPFAHSTLTPATNPHRFRIYNNVEVCGFSSQITEALSKVIRPRQGEPCSGEVVTDILQNALSWRHMCPVAPDTLACYPFFDRDPFIIESTPHVFFAAGASSFATNLFSEGSTISRLIAVPNLNLTGEAVLVNLDTLSCGVLRIEWM